MTGDSRWPRPPPATMRNRNPLRERLAMHANELSLDEKLAFYRDGFIVVREAVPRDLTFAARRAINVHTAQAGVRRPVSRPQRRTDVA